MGVKFGDHLFYEKAKNWSNLVLERKYYIDLHRPFLRHQLGILKSAPGILLMCGLRRKPLVMSIIKQVLNFWNRVQSRTRSDLVKIATMENCELARQSSGKLSFWAGHFNFLLVNSVILDIVYQITVTIKLTLTSYLLNL